MTIRLHIPVPFRAIPSGVREVSAQGGDVAEILQNLDQLYPGLRGELFESNGQLHQYINVYVDGTDIRFLAGVRTPVSSGSTVMIIAALAGG